MQQQNQGGYSIKINDLCILDCYDSNDSCHCSMANCSVGAVDINNIAIVPNARLCISYTPFFCLVSLEPTTDILEGEEIFWDYGDLFIYPDYDAAHEI